MNQAKERTEHPMSNTQYPRRKDREAIPATPALDIGNSLLVIGHSSPPSRGASSHE